MDGSTTFQHVKMTVMRPSQVYVLMRKTVTSALTTVLEEIKPVCASCVNKGQYSIGEADC